MAFDSAAWFHFNGFFLFWWSFESSGWNFCNIFSFFSSIFLRYCLCYCYFCLLPALLLQTTSVVTCSHCYSRLHTRKYDFRLMLVVCNYFLTPGSHYWNLFLSAEWPVVSSGWQDNLKWDLTVKPERSLVRMRKRYDIIVHPFLPFLSFRAATSVRLIVAALPRPC